MKIIPTEDKKQWTTLGMLGDGQPFRFARQAKEIYIAGWDSDLHHTGQYASVWPHTRQYIDISNGKVLSDIRSTDVFPANFVAVEE